MKVALWMIGKTSFVYLREGEALYTKRLGRYLPFETTVLPDVKGAKKLKAAQLQQKEGEMVLQRLKAEDILVLLDERGFQKGSVAFAQYLDQQLQRGRGRLVFLIGGAYGFAPAVYQRADAQWSLSKLTFSHQMIRIFVLEQLYRACTILRNEPYHNEG